MSSSLKYLRAAVVGFALIVGGRALYENRDLLRRSWKSLGGLEWLKDSEGNLSVGKVLGSVSQIREIANQLSHLK